MSSIKALSKPPRFGDSRAVRKQLRWEAAGEVLLLDERFTLNRLLGSGAYGIVCEVFDEKKRVKYAVKKCIHIFKSQSVALRTLREIRLLRLMRHDHIVNLESVLDVDGPGTFNDVYVVLEYMETDLSKIIHSDQPLSEGHVEYFMAQLVSACIYMHASGIIHRDLKPKNLLINSNCLLKVADFGLARSITQELMSQTSKMTDYVTTRWYRAPEILCGWPGYSKAVDMWSVGTILAELISRAPVFPGTSTSDQLQRIVDVLGSPSPAFTNKCTSERRASFLRSLDSSISAVRFEDLYPTASRNSIALLDMLLEWDPASRASAAETGAHPYFAKVQRFRAVDFNVEPLTDLHREFDFESRIPRHDRDMFIRNEIIQEVRNVKIAKYNRGESSRLFSQDSPVTDHSDSGEAQTSSCLRSLTPTHVADDPKCSRNSCTIN